MSDVSPTAAPCSRCKDERRAMHEGYVFLDEKCLLLAGEILRELGAPRRAAARVAARLHDDALARAAGGASARHGLHGLQVYPPAELARRRCDARRAR